MSSLDLLQAQRRSESSARLAPLLALQKLEGKSDAAALPALPVRPGKAHAALPLASGRGTTAFAAMALRAVQGSKLPSTNVLVSVQSNSQVPFSRQCHHQARDPSTPLPRESTARAGRLLYNLFVTPEFLAPRQIPALDEPPSDSRGR